MDLFLWQLYQSPRCAHFYVGLLCFGVFLVLIMMVDGFKIADSKLFISLEFFLNMVVTTDVGLRLRLNGFWTYF